MLLLSFLTNLSASRTLCNAITFKYILLANAWSSSTHKKMKNFLSLALRHSVTRIVLECACCSFKLDPTTITILQISPSSFSPVFHSMLRNYGSYHQSTWVCNSTYGIFISVNLNTVFQFLN